MALPFSFFKIGFKSLFLLACWTGGVNLIDTAEQYPIPSDRSQCPEGSTEALIGAWLAKGGDQKVTRRDKVGLEGEKRKRGL
jgi:aryl-alcohol dehydrogenase-like predicted oxidoreductase